MLAKQSIEILKKHPNAEVSFEYSHPTEPYGEIVIDDLCPTHKINIANSNFISIKVI